MIAPSTKAPEINLEPLDINNLLDELREYHAIYSPLFRRREQREQAEKYMHGLALDIPRKAIEPMVLALDGADPNAVRATQHFISEGAWDDEPILERHWQEVDKDLGDEDGVFILDGSGFAKQGSESVGVKHQYCGELGKVANCQVGVFLGYASEKGHTLLDRRLYLPKEWVEDEEFAERREKCGVPEEIEFGTKPELGWEMVERIYEKGSLRGPVVTAHRTYRRWLACDTVYGQDPRFLDKVANETDLWYYAEVPCDTRAWLERPATEVPEWSGRGRKPTCEQLVEGEPEAQQVEAIARALPPSEWSRRTIKEGSKGPIVADFTALRVTAVRDGLPGPEVWLVLRRNVKTGELKFYLSNAPKETPFATLVQMSGQSCGESCGHCTVRRAVQCRHHRVGRDHRAGCFPSVSLTLNGYWRCWRIDKSEIMLLISPIASVEWHLSVKWPEGYAEPRMIVLRKAVFEHLR